MKRIKIDDDNDDEVDKVLNKQVMASIKITDEQKKSVYKAFWKYTSQKIVTSVNKDTFWNFYKEFTEI